MPDLQPGREEQLCRLRRWLAFSKRLDRLIEASETRPAFRPAPVLASAPLPASARRPASVRATLAVRLARLARAVHAEAAATAVRESKPR